MEGPGEGMGRKEEGVLRIEMRIRFAQGFLGQRPSSYDRGDRHTSGHKRVKNRHCQTQCSPLKVFRFPWTLSCKGCSYSRGSLPQLKHGC